MVNKSPVILELKIGLENSVINGIIIEREAILCVMIINIIPTSTVETETPIKAPAAHSIEIMEKLIISD